MNPGHITCFVVFLVGSLGWPEGAHAQHVEPTSVAKVEFRWTVDPTAAECISASALISEVNARLGRTVFVPDDGDYRLNGRAHREGAEIVVEFDLVTRSGAPRGRRVLRSIRRCDRLDDTIAVVIVLLVDLAREELAREEIAIVVPVEVASEPDIASAPADASILPTNGPSPFAIQLSLGAEGSIDRVPGPALAAIGAAEVGLRNEWWAIRLEAVFTPEVASTEMERGGLYFAFQGGLGICGDASALPSLSIGVCSGMRAGAIHGVGVGFERTLEGWLPYVAGLVGGRTRVFPGGPLFFEIALGFEIPFITDAFAVRTGTSSYRLFAPAPIVPTLSISIGLADR
jgi:hypothetical protein